MKIRTLSGALLMHGRFVQILLYIIMKGRVRANLQKVIKNQITVPLINAHGIVYSAKSDYHCPQSLGNLFCQILMLPARADSPDFPLAILW